MSSTESKTHPVSLKESHRFIKDCLIAVGALETHADALADNLILADYRGHYSHGMNRLEMYLGEIQNGICDAKSVPEIIKQTPATAWVEGHAGLGVVVGNYCMKIAIEKAKNVGIGWVVAKGSNHYGIAGAYSLQALQEGLIGMSCTNTSPVVAPTRTKSVAYGTNPISLAAPGLNNDSFDLDMPTSAVAVGKIEMKRRTHSEIPDQWVHKETGALYPLGGREESSGYKGYGLGILVEIITTILAGGAYGENVRHLGHYDKLANLGQCFIAINPSCFAPGFEERLSDLMASLRNMDSINPDKPVLVAGDPEKAHMLEVDKTGCVRYVQDQVDSCQKVAAALKVKPLQPKTEFY